MEKVEYVLDFCKELGKQMIIAGANIERVDLGVNISAMHMDCMMWHALI